MSYNYGHYEDDEGRNLGYIPHYEQFSPSIYSNSYIPPSSTNYSSANYSSVPMSYSNSGSSMTSHGSHGSHNSYNTYPSSPDSYTNSTQTIHPGAATTNSYLPIDIAYTDPIKTSTKGSSSSSSHKSRTSSTSTKSSGSLHCLHPNCEYQTKRQYDLDRHQRTHFPSNPSEKFDCTGRGCGRTGEYGFDRKDHLREHLRKVHAKDIPKQNRRSSKSPNQGRR